MLNDNTSFMFNSPGFIRTNLPNIERVEKGEKEFTISPIKYRILLCFN